MSTRPSFEIQTRNAPKAYLSDLYYRLVGLAWRYLLLEAFLFYLFVNLSFGSIYYALRSGLRPQNLSFLECYFFSVHTFSTVGYGSIVPYSPAVNLVTVMEIFCGLVSMALLTGLCFAKFSRPLARFMFSKHILITKYRGKRAIICRMANARTNTVMNAEVTLTAMYDEVTSEGIRYRRLEDLALERARTPVFILTMTVAHIIEPGGLSERLIDCLDRKEKDVEFLLSVRGVDETLGQTIHDMHVFTAEAVMRDRQFEDVLSEADGGAIVIDYANFHELKK
ncbi:MAG: ion channel [Bdellovibrionota bacterium]